MRTLEERLIEQAYQLGFSLAGIAPATEADGFDHLRAWLDEGYAGAMSWMHEHGEARRHPRSILPAVRSVIMVGMNYAPTSSVRKSESVSGEWREKNQQSLSSLATHHPHSHSSEHPHSLGRIARYARGADYHGVLRQKLKQLGTWLHEQRPECWGRAVVDTAPLLERDFAQRAGLGWFGKNTMLLNTRLGSWFVLGGLLVDIELAANQPFTTNHCGTCTACLDACPTHAFVAPRVLDSRRCISYLTIELRQQVPEDLRSEVGDWLFGCDICQEVCPWNRKAPPGSMELAPRADLQAVDVIELLGMQEPAFRQRFAGTALHPRPGRAVVLRNAALVLGNIGDSSALPALRAALNDPAELVREAAAWAMARIAQRASLAGV